MKTYYIYHIPGVKIGCTSDLSQRMSSQGFTSWEIIETHTDPQIAGDRELELQREYGYPVDNSHYMVSIENFRKAGVIGGRNAKQKGQYREYCRAGGRAVTMDPNHSNKLEWECENCGATGKARVNYVRWHGNNCKMKQS